MKRILARLLMLAAAASMHAAVDSWDDLERALTFAVPRHAFRARISGELNLEGYQGEQSSTGFVFSESDRLLNPRLSLFLDAQQGTRWYAFAQARVDRGFDPSNGKLEARLDEYAVRWMALDDGHLYLQAGQFGTLLGNWGRRHLAWDNPFVGAPLPYEHFTGLYAEHAPVSLADLNPHAEAEEYDYSPIIWGPSYASGVSAFGRVGRFDYGIEVKNTGPSARPEAWPITAVGFERPSYNARLGLRPDMRWKLGVSFSDSTYLLPSVSRPPGTRLGDYRELVFGQDLSFAWHHWQVWAELFEASFRVPHAGSARTCAGYVEARYKLTPQLFGALRLNRQTFSSVPDGTGGSRPWGVNVSRLDLAAVYRWTPYMQIKGQATIRDEDASGGELLPSYAAQLTLRF